MRSLPLYDGSEPLPIEADPALDLDRDCTRCGFSAGKRTVCMSADGEPGGLLVVGEAPNGREDQAGRPFTAEAGMVVRNLVAELWSRPVVFDYAVRCSPSADQRQKKAGIGKAISACRGFLSRTYLETTPERIVVLGPWAAQSVLGRSVSGFQMRRSYAYTEDGVPVYVLLSPSLTLRNRFLRDWLREDLTWALRGPLPLTPPMRGHAFLIDNALDARVALDLVRRAPIAAIDVESAGLLFTKGFRLLSVSLTPKGSRDGFVWTQEALADPEAVGLLRAYLADEDAKKTGANVKFDLLAGHWTGLKIRGVEVDVRLWRKLLEPESSAKLADMANLVGMGGHKREADQAMQVVLDKVSDRLTWEKKMADIAAHPLTKAGKARKLPEEPPTLAAVGLDPFLEDLARNPDVDPGAWKYAMLPKDTLYRYNARDTVSTMDLTDYMEPLLAVDAGLQRTWDTLVRPASLAIAQVEQWGVGVDKDALLTFDLYLEHKLAEANTVLRGFNADINWNSVDQVREYLFGRLKLPVLKRTDTDKESTDADALEELRGKHGVIDALLNFRRFDKLRGTYTQGLLPHIRPDGRVHPTFLLDGARSGRASCQDPNVQNIPRAGTTEGRMARDMFFAREGYKLLELDYSQIELRVAAMLSGDPLMIQIFLEGHDFHQRTAELVSQVAWGIPPSEVTGEHRSQAKAVNFGAMYGQGPSALAKKLSQGGTEVSYTEAENIQRVIFGKFQKLAAYFRACLTESRKTGFARTFWDGQVARRRPLYKVADPDDGVRITAEHGSWNTPIQGTAADYLTASLGAVVPWILDSGIDAKLCMVVHDSMLFEVRADQLDDLAGNARRIMESWPSGGVPIIVDAKAGHRWGSLSSYKFSP